MQSVPQVQNPTYPMHGIFNDDSSNNAMNLIAFFQEQFGEIGSILSGDAGNQCAGHTVCSSFSTERMNSANASFQ